MVKVYMVDEKYHRVNGPAKIWDDGDFDWYINGQRHRYYGPQNPRSFWWIHGKVVKW